MASAEDDIKAVLSHSGMSRADPSHTKENRAVLSHSRDQPKDYDAVPALGRAKLVPCQAVPCASVPDQNRAGPCNGVLIKN